VCAIQMELLVALGACIVTQGGGHMTDSTAQGIADEAARMRPMLYRLALIQLRDPVAAEDVTQDTLLAAMESANSFQERSSVRTWLLAILRFKVIDAMRERRRKENAPIGASQDSDLGTEKTSAYFNEFGQWRDLKDTWSDPESVAERNEFLSCLEACMAKLPARSAKAFFMREWLELDPKEICEELALSPGNLRVLLYRARMQLRGCLEENWRKKL
jgi:RNA polymerase sigma-70 factor, ECF subfamily